MKKVGRYEVISELGRGAMGIVYRASDPTIGREVALKVISLNAAQDGAKSPQQMFMREVRAAGRLAHPSIVTIHDAFDEPENQTCCIVMELVPGDTLEKILESGRRLTVQETLFLIRQVAEALDYAHRNQVIHRDLKPANILVTADARAKITDFGIAKILAREGAARTVGIMGTPSYMSPEQVRGGEIDARTDIFSLGIILYTLLTGIKPFAGNTAAVMFKIVYEEPSAPSGTNPELAPAHDYVVKKCLAKDRNQRYSSVRELLGDLDDLQFDREPRSQAADPAPAPAVSTDQPIDRTMAMGIPTLLKAALKPSPAPVSPAVPPPMNTAAPPAKTPPGAMSADLLKSDESEPTLHTVAMPVQRPTEAAAQQSKERQTPPASPSVEPQDVAPTPPLKDSASLPSTAGSVGATAGDGKVVAPVQGQMPPAPPMPPRAHPPQPAAPPPPAAVAPAEPPRAASHPARTQGVPPAPKAPAPKPVPELRPASLPLTGQTLTMRVPDLSALDLSSGSLGQLNPPPSAGLPQADRTLPLRAEDLHAAVPSPLPPQKPGRVAPTPPDVPLGGQTIPMRAPDFYAASLNRLPAREAHAVPPPPAPVVGADKLPMQGPGLPVAPVAVGMPSTPPPPNPRPIDARIAEPFQAPVRASAKPSSKVLPALIAGIAFAVLAAVGWGYWNYHSTTVAHAPSTQATQPTPPPPAPPVSAETVPATSTLATAAPIESITPPPPAAETSRTPSAKMAAEVPKNNTARRPKPTITSQPAAITPVTAAVQPPPVVAAPSLQPATVSPSAEEIARAEAAKNIAVPRIIQVAGSYDLKEAIFTFSSGGKTLWEETLKGKKKKGGFLGIKGSYEGTFAHTITVPAGMSEVTLRVMTKDGAIDMKEGIKIPAGGFVPTLAVAADSDHLSLNWRNSSGTN